MRPFVIQSICANDLQDELKNVIHYQFRLQSDSIERLVVKEKMKWSRSKVRRLGESAIGKVRVWLSDSLPTEKDGGRFYKEILSLSNTWDIPMWSRPLCQELHYREHQSIIGSSLHKHSVFSLTNKHPEYSVMNFNWFTKVFFLRQLASNAGMLVLALE